MVFGWMVLGPVIASIVGAWAPVDAELFLGFVVAEPVVTHVHGLGGFGLDFVGYNPICRGVVGLDWCGWLRMAHFDQQVALGHCVFRIDVQASHL
jgi:hypothetical protein